MVAAAICLVVGGCSTESPGSEAAGGKTDELSGVQAALADRNDPIGIWLREASDLTEDGILSGDYGTLLEGADMASALEAL